MVRRTQVGMKLNRIFKRKPAGVPDGGQFAQDQKAEAAVTLGPSTAEHEFKLHFDGWTPYGAAQPYKIEAEGVQRFTTPFDDRHFVRLSEERNAAIPEQYRNENRYYASDDSYARQHKADELDVVIATHPEAFEEEEVEWARQRIALHDAPQDLQADLSEVRARASVARSKAERIRAELAAHEKAEQKWIASTVAAGALEHFPDADSLDFMRYGDGLIGSIRVTDRRGKILGMMSVMQNGRVIGDGGEEGQQYLVAAMHSLEAVPDDLLREQGAGVGPGDEAGDRAVVIHIAPVLGKAAERCR